MLQEHDLTAEPPELLEEEHLMSVLAGQPVGTKDRQHGEPALAGGVAQAVQARAVEAGAAVAFVGEAMLGKEVIALLLHPGLEGSELAVDRLVAFLPFRRDPGIDSRMHRSPPVRPVAECPGGPPQPSAGWRAGGAGADKLAPPEWAPLDRGCSRRALSRSWGKGTVNAWAS